MLSFPFFDPSRPPPPVAPPPNQSALDQSFVQHFLSTRTARKVASQNASASISELREKITDLVSELDLLKTKKATLEKEMHLQPASSWQSNIEQLAQLQQNIREKLLQLSDPLLNDQVSRKLRVRKKKRAWQARRNARLKDQKDARRNNRDQLHERINAWQRDQRKLLEEEKLAQQQLDFANHFLADVQRRKAACKRYLAKFEMVRESRRRYQHEGDDADLTELNKKWTTKLAQCIREEKRLKDVLARRSDANYRRRVENEWNRALFGDVIPNKFEHLLLDRDVLVRTRWQWDACLVEDDCADASTIPLGWVLPPKDPAPEWAQYQMKEASWV